MRLKEFLLNEDGVGVIEVVLILVVLIGLVIVFKDQITGMVNRIFEKANTGVDEVLS